MIRRKRRRRDRKYLHDIISRVRDHVTYSPAAMLDNNLLLRLEHQLVPTAVVDRMHQRGEIEGVMLRSSLRLQRLDKLLNRIYRVQKAKKICSLIWRKVNFRGHVFGYDWWDGVLPPTKEEYQLIVSKGLSTIKSVEFLHWVEGIREGVDNPVKCWQLMGDPHFPKDLQWEQCDISAMQQVYTRSFPMEWVEVTVAPDGGSVHVGMGIMMEGLLERGYCEEFILSPYQPKRI